MSSNSVLKMGARGDQVRQLQQFLNSQGYNVGAVDGIFGNKTLAGVKAFQQANNLAVDGIVGGQTWGAINSLKGNTATAKATPAATPGVNAHWSNIQGITHNRLTESEMRERAESLINPQLNAEKQAMQHQTQRYLQALDQQREAIDPAYEKMIEELGQFYNYERGRNSQDALARGVARSSIPLAMNEMTSRRESKAINEAQENRIRDLRMIDEQKTLLQQQLAEAEARLDVDGATRILAKIQELQDREDQIAMEVQKFNIGLDQWKYGQKSEEERWAEQLRQWEKEFAFKQSEANRSHSLAQQQLALQKQKTAASASSKSTKVSQPEKLAELRQAFLVDPATGKQRTEQSQVLFIEGLLNRMGEAGFANEFGSSALSEYKAFLKKYYEEREKVKESRWGESLTSYAQNEIDSTVKDKGFFDKIKDGYNTVKAVFGSLGKNK